MHKLAVPRIRYAASDKLPYFVTQSDFVLKTESTSIVQQDKKLITNIKSLKVISNFDHQTDFKINVNKIIPITGEKLRSCRL